MRDQPLVLGSKLLPVSPQATDLLAKSVDIQSLDITDLPMPIEQLLELVQLPMKMFSLHGLCPPSSKDHSRVGHTRQGRAVCQPASGLYASQDARQFDNAVTCAPSQGWRNAYSWRGGKEAMLNRKIARYFDRREALW